MANSPYTSSLTGPNLEAPARILNLSTGNTSGGTIYSQLSAGTYVVKVDASNVISVAPLGSATGFKTYAFSDLFHIDDRAAASDPLKVQTSTLGAGEYVVSVDSNRNVTYSLYNSSFASNATLTNLKTAVTANHHTLYDLHECISGAYLCAATFFTVSGVEYCAIHDLLSDITYLNFGGYTGSTTITAYAADTAAKQEDFKAHTLSDSTMTMLQLKTLLTKIGAIGNKYIFDVSSLSIANMGLVAIKVDQANLLYRIFDITTGYIAEGVYSDSLLLTTALSRATSLAKVDGYYPQMHVGLADNLSSPDGITDTPENDPENNPFIFRTSAGIQSITDGNAELTLLGKTAKEYQEDLSTILENIEKGVGEAAYPAGTQFSFLYNTYNCPVNIVDHHDAVVLENNQEVTRKVLWTEWEYSIPDNIVFDPAEAMACISSVGLPAGEYYFKINGDSWGSKNGQYYSFTTTDNLTEGMQLKPNGSYNSTADAVTQINVYANGKATSATYSYALANHGTTPPSSGKFLGTLWGTDMDSTIKSSFKSDDNIHFLNHYHCIYLGNNEWETSYIRQYLNASNTGWWVSQGVFDRAPTGVDSVIGFFGTLPEDWRNAIKVNKVYNLHNSVTHDGSEYFTYDKIFLHSKKQMAWEEEGTETHNYEWTYYRDLANKILGGTTNKFQNYQTYPGLIRYGINATSTARYMWTRSAHRSYGYIVWSVHPSGDCSTSTASHSFGCAPACVIAG